MSSATSYVWVPLSRPVFMKKLGVDGQNSKHKTIWATTCPQSEKYQTSPRIMATEKRQRYIFYLWKTPVTFLPLRSFHSCSFSALNIYIFSNKNMNSWRYGKSHFNLLVLRLEKKKNIKKKKNNCAPRGGHWLVRVMLFTLWVSATDIAWHAIYCL